MYETAVSTGLPSSRYRRERITVVVSSLTFSRAATSAGGTAVLTLIMWAAGWGDAGPAWGLVRVLAADPKLMELASGRAIFERYGGYESDPHAITATLEHPLSRGSFRAGGLGGEGRSCGSPRGGQGRQAPPGALDFAGVPGGHGGEDAGAPDMPGA